MPTIEIPRDVYDALDVPEPERDDVLRRELAVALYREDVLSTGKARTLADASRREFHRLLGERGVDRHYGPEALDEDVEYASE